MIIKLAPRTADSQDLFDRLCRTGLTQPNKHCYTLEEWHGKKDAKGRVITPGINPDIVKRFMCDHSVTVSLKCLDEFSDHTQGDCDMFWESYTDGPRSNGEVYSLAPMHLLNKVAYVPMTEEQKRISRGNECEMENS